MNRVTLVVVLAAFTAGCQPIAEQNYVQRLDDHTHGPGGHTHEGGPAYTYLTMTGEFEMDPVQAATRDDPRNPSRIRLATSEEAGSTTRMAFYAHEDPSRLVADCAYQFAGSRPDPYYFPDESKTSIWDVFEQVDTYEGACDDYAVVISRSPHGDPSHMHLRYGTDAEALLAMSTAPVDSAAFNPWWPLYCEPGLTETCE